MTTTAPALPRHLEAHRRRRLARGRRTVVHDCDVVHVDRDDVSARPDGDRVVGKANRPHEACGRDAAREVVRSRARTGLEQIDSDEGERPSPRHTVGGDVVSLEDADVVHHHPPVASGVPDPRAHVRERHDTLEVPDRGRVGSETVEAERARSRREDALPPRGPGSDRSHRPSVLVPGTQGARPQRPTPTDRLSTAASVAIKRRAPGRSSETGIHALCDLRPRRGSPVRALVDEAVAARHNRAMAEAMELQWVSLEPSPVIEAYKKDVDRTLIRENLKLTPDERIKKMISVLRFVEEVRRTSTSGK